MFYLFITARTAAIPLARAVKFILEAKKFFWHEIFNVNNFSSILRTTKIRCADNLIIQKIDYTKISWSTVVRALIALIVYNERIDTLM